jgi:hypothetical protein
MTAMAVQSFYQLFRCAPLDSFKALYRSLDNRLEQRGDCVICSSVDRDGETASDIAAKSREVVA